MHAYNFAMATIEQLMQLFLFMCELQIKPFVLENQVFDTPARNGPNDGQGEITAIL